MKLHVDPDVDAAYLRLTDAPVVESEEVAPGIVLDYDEAGEVVGVEILSVTRRGGKLTAVEIAPRAA